MELRLISRVKSQTKVRRRYGHTAYGIWQTHRKRSCPAVSHICNRTTVSLSSSTTRFVKKLAPTVLVVLAGVNWFLTYRCTKLQHKAPIRYEQTVKYQRTRQTDLVLPTPCDPRTTILASRLPVMSPSRLLSRAN